MEYNFDDIRPFYDEEVNQVIKQLLQDPVFLKGLETFPGNLPIEPIKQKLSGIESIYDFQSKFVKDLVEIIAKHTTNGLTLSGLENINPQSAFLFISNHRDIVMDSAFMNYLLHVNGFPTSQVAIGSNLMLVPMIKNFVRLNKSFIVNRNIPPRQAYAYAQKLSAYIRKTLINENTSIWIAQREGRSKDNTDLTQPSLLKMISISGENNLKAYFEKLKIVPVSISYQFDPCDALKTIELANKDNPDFKKDDGKSMLKGIMGFKGEVHFHFGQPLDDLSACSDNKNDFFKDLSKLLDEKIHANYKFWPENYMAYDFKNKENKFGGHYNDQNVKDFQKYIQDQIREIGAPEELSTGVINIYAQTLENKLRIG